IDLLMWFLARVFFHAVIIRHAGRLAPVRPSSALSPRPLALSVLPCAPAGEPGRVVLSKLSIGVAPMARPAVNVAVRAARAAGAIILRYMNRVDSLKIEEKARMDFATE